MNVTEANAANVVLRRALGLAPDPTDEQLLDAARLLAAKANKALSAGLTAADVRLPRPRTTEPASATSHPVHRDTGSDMTHGYRCVSAVGCDPMFGAHGRACLRANHIEVL